MSSEIYRSRSYLGYGASDCGSCHPCNSSCC